MKSSSERSSCGSFYLWLNYYSLILPIVRMGRPSQKGVLKIKINTLTKGHIGHQGEKGQVLKHPLNPPLHAPALISAPSALTCSDNA